MQKYDFAVKSPVRVCFTGGSKAGSWEMRGEQMAATRTNWAAKHDLSSEDEARFDAFVFVKHPNAKVMKKLRTAGKLVLYDVIDSWAQPADGLTHTSVSQARELFRRKWAGLSADVFIFANHTMFADLRPLVPGGTFLYHHYRPEYEPLKPLSEVARVVGYEGNSAYLGEWLPRLQAACDRLGLELRLNPADLRDVDIGFAARGGEHDSFLANRYKSNVKLANFYGAGIPCVVGAKEVSYHETDNGSVRFFADEAQLVAQLEALKDYETRKAVRESFLKVREAYSLPTICGRLESFIETAVSRR